MGHLYPITITVNALHIKVRAIHALNLDEHAYVTDITGHRHPAMTDIQEHHCL